MFKVYSVFLFMLGLGLLLALGTSMIEAQPFTQVSPDNTLIIDYPKYEYWPANNTFYLNFHVSNVTDYNTLPGTTCLVHLYLPNGKHVYQGWATMDSNNIDYKVDIDKGNFSTLGKHPYYISCNSTGQTGFVGGVIEVTHYGLKPITDSTGLILSYVIFVVIIILII